MERDWLESRLADGESFEAIAREAGCHPSTVSYWARRYGLSSMHVDRHAARGPIERELLAEIVALEVSVRDIAEALGRSPTTVRHWLRRYGLETARTVRTRVARAPLPENTPPGMGRCPDHGVTPFVRDRDGRSRCRKCRVDGVARRRERLRAILVAEAGGACAICGFDAHRSALHFHHIDPAGKAFTIRNGDTRSLDRMREEARKCILLCANCHALVEAGALQVPVRSVRDGAFPG